MAPQWYYTHAGEQRGPVSFETLEHLASTGHLMPSDDVCCEGMPEWLPASKVTGLFRDHAKPPPPLLAAGTGLHGMRSRRRPVRGWVVPAALWITVAICATGFQGCSRILRANVQPIGRAVENPFSYRAGRLAGATMAAMVLIIVHWFLLWRRQVNLRRYRYWVWTGIQIAWTGLMALTVIVESAYLIMALGARASAVIPMHNPTAQQPLLLLTISTVLYALATAGWVFVLIAVPDDA